MQSKVKFRSHSNLLIQYLPFFLRNQVEFTTFRKEFQSKTLMKTKLSLLLIILVSIVAGCTSKTGKQGTSVLSHSDVISISGAYALSPIMQVWITEFKKTHPYVKFQLSANGSGQGIKDLIAGKVDLAMISQNLPKGKDSLLWIAPVARLGIVPVMNPKNPNYKTMMEKGVSREILSALFTGNNTMTWGELAGNQSKDKVNVYFRSDSSGATATLAKYLEIDKHEIKGFPVSGEDQLIKQVKDDPLAFSYVNFIYAFDPVKKEFLNDLKIVPITITVNGKPEAAGKIFDTYEHLQRSMWLGRYPSSLIRTLYLVTKGKPRTREMFDFMYWIITDGQRFVADNGYIELHSGEVETLVNNMKALTP
jgi:phosphate transport system substrate-binding protein